MKKWARLIILYFAICFSAGYVIGWISDTRKAPEQNFEIYQSFISDGGGYRTTYLRVFALNQEYNISLLLDEIREYHDNMNGISDELEITLYGSEEELKNCDQPIAVKTYYKE